MHPHMKDLQPDPVSGISQVVKNYFKYLPEFDIELVDQDGKPDLVAIHAGALHGLPDLPIVAHNHGLYWTADKDMGTWTHGVNQTVIQTARHATIVTVPSRWVAEAFKRDMHFSPVVIPHGVEWEVWQGGEDLGYVLWNKNRSSDACDPTPVNELSSRAPHTRFLTTYAAPNPRPNVRVTSTVPFSTMRDMILKCSVYLATTKETFGIGTLEAMAASKPILGFDYGGTSDLVKHGYSGYLARPGDYDDLARGLEYCMKHRYALGRNAAFAASDYTWQKTAYQVARQYALTLDIHNEHPTIAVVIPMYNKAATVLRAIRSAINQTDLPDEIVVVNNNSTDDYQGQIDIAFKEADAAGITLLFVNCPDQGVAHARNFGIELADKATYICCLDADDEILPGFLGTTYWELQQDRSLGIAYAAMEVINQEGGSTISGWPSAYNFNLTLRGKNQVPTCCLFRREAWVRAGGYRQRYAPAGAGSEDADLWLRMGLLGWGGIQASEEPLFRYYLGGAVSGNPHYREKDWRGDKGWIATNDLPFAATSDPENAKAHLVRQYDEPLISVIIPVGPGHTKMVIDAIDSVEGQTFRQWELIVVDDSGPETAQSILTQNALAASFPFIRFVTTVKGPRGAGHARNLGAEIAKAPLLLFLDADDWLTPTALADMMDAHNEFPSSIIYSDYIGYAYIEDTVELQKLRSAQRLLDYNERTKEAKVLYYAFDFDCSLAQRQPERGKNPWVWNIVSSLVPASYHREVGGFDDQMTSWEDWDYWVRLAKQGKCFYRITKPLLEYRFYTGRRRAAANPGESGESGRQLSGNLLEYMREKYERIEIMPCSGCGGGRRSSSPPPAARNMSISEEKMSNVSSNDMVQVELIDGNEGDHLIAFQGTSYGYRVNGDRFSMLRSHAQLDRRVRIITGNQAPTAKARTEPASMPPPPPEFVEPIAVLPVPKEPEPWTPPLADEYDLTKLWGINEDRAVTLKTRGVRTPHGVALMTTKDITTLFGVSDLVARRIVAEAQKVTEEIQVAKEERQSK